MWPLSARPPADGAVGDVKVSLPPQLDLRDTRFQLGSAAGGGGPAVAKEGQPAPQHQPVATSAVAALGVAGLSAGLAGAAARTLHRSSLSGAGIELLNSGSTSPAPNTHQQAKGAGFGAGGADNNSNHDQASNTTNTMSSASHHSSTTAPAAQHYQQHQQHQRHQQQQSMAAPEQKTNYKNYYRWIQENTSNSNAAAPAPAGPSTLPNPSSIYPSIEEDAGEGSSSTGDKPQRPRHSRGRRLDKLRRRAKTMEPPVLSFYGAQPVPLTSRFAAIKKRLIAGHEEAVAASWTRLLAALRDEMTAIADAPPSELVANIEFADIEDPARIAAFNKQLRRFGVGVVRGVVPADDAAGWVEETRRYLETKHDIKPPSPQDPTCFDFFWTPAQIRARAHPHVLRAMKFAMSLWDAEDDDRMATRFPITYADRIRIHVSGSGATGVAPPVGSGAPPTPTRTPSTTDISSSNAAVAAAAAAAAASVDGSEDGVIIAQVDGGSLERWEPDGYGHSGTYNSIFRGEWESYDPWDPTGRISATPDLYNGAGACSIFRMFQGLLALTDVTPGMIRLLPSPKLVTAYFLLRPFFSPRTPPPADLPASSAGAGSLYRRGPEWEAFLAADNWVLDAEPSTILHGAVPGHAQRVTELWHPHLDLKRTLVAPPDLHTGDYVIWHCETAYTITSAIDSRPATPAPASSTSPERPERYMVYAPSCPLTQTNALYLARQRKAFMRGHPGPDFDLTGTGLGTEAPHIGRLGENEIREVGGDEALRAMGLVPWNSGPSTTTSSSASAVVPAGDKMDIDAVDGKPEPSYGAAGEAGSGSVSPPLTQAEVDLVRLANIILFPDKYEFFMATRHSTPDGGKP